MTAAAAVRSASPLVTFGEAPCGGACLQRDELFAVTLLDEQRRRILAAGDIERLAFFAIEAGDLSRRQHEADARRRRRQILLRVAFLAHHEHDEASGVLLHKIAAHGLRAELV